VETRTTFSIRTSPNLEVEGTINPVVVVSICSLGLHTYLAPYHRCFASEKPLQPRQRAISFSETREGNTKTYKQTK
jgi:hypothetical protein